MIGIYCRRSHKETDRQVSIEIQKEQGIAFAHKRGAEYKIYSDVGISGTKDEIEDRPQFAQMLYDIEKKVIDSVWVLDQSRLERNPRIWQIFQYLLTKEGVKFYVDGKEQDLNDPQTKLIAGVISLTNEMYAKLTGMKVRAAHLKNVTNGKGVGLSAFGYEKDKEGYVVIKDEEAKIVKRMFDLSLQGNGSYTIAKIFNSENIPTKYNSFKGSIERKESYTGTITKFEKKNVKWRGNVIYDIITNTIYKGKKKWNDGFVDAPVIIDEELWDKVNANLQLNKKNVGKKEQYNYLLNGLIYCANCGLPMHGKKRLKGKDSAYKCNHQDKLTMGCRGFSISKLETFVIHHLFQSKELRKLLLEQPESKFGISVFRSKLNENKTRLKMIEGKIKKAYELLLDPDFSEDETIKSHLKLHKSEKEKLTFNIGELETKVIEMEMSSRKQRVKGLMDAYTLDCDFSTTKKLVHSLVERLSVHHDIDVNGKGFFLFDLKYKGFDEKSIFSTDYKARKFLWLHRYRGEPVTEEDRQEDIETIDGLREFYKIEGKTNYPRIQTVEGGTFSSIIINEEDLIEFG